MLPLFYRAIDSDDLYEFHTSNPKILRFFSSKGIECSQEMKVENDSSKVIIGSSRDPRRYNKLIKYARQNNIPSEMYLDSWVNYELRVEENPDIISVTDSWARQQAELKFPTIPIVKFPNKFVDFLSTHLSTGKEYVLYVDSPANEYNNLDLIKHPYNCICAISRKIESIFNTKLRYRGHPGYSQSECLSEKETNFDVSAFEIEYDLSKAYAVIGPVSQLHFYAEYIGVPSFTYPDPNEHWSGPAFRSIQQLIMK